VPSPDPARRSHSLARRPGLHFLDAWTSLPPFELLRLLIPAGLLLAAVFVPGRRMARVVALAVAATLPGHPDLGADLLPWGWCALWIAVAWGVGVARGPSSTELPPRPGGFESGAVGLLLSLAIVTLLVVAIGRQNLTLDITRRASYAVLLIGAGVLHLLLRRDMVRAMVAFGALGLGLQSLDGIARESMLPIDDAPQGLVLAATAMAVGLAARIAWVRQRDAGSAWVNDAHDLHD
jgi:hypothetical protein